MHNADVRILGTGIVSRVTALSLARQRLQVSLQARPAASAPMADLRAYALNPAAVAILQSLRVWSALPEDARTLVADMAIQGDDASHLDFSAWGQTVTALAWIVDAQALADALESAVAFAPDVHLATEPAAAPLTVVAEGKTSATREGLQVPFERHGYGHAALAARLVADRPHDGVARQWFRSPDIVALLPFDRPAAGHSYGLVWSMPAAQAEAMAALDDAAFEAELAEVTGGVAGTLRLGSERGCWPLATGRAERTVGRWPGDPARAWALVGDAAHVVHPLAGQGLNLGLADVQCLAEVLGQREPGRSVADERLLRRYARERHLANGAVATMTDGLWQLFAHSNPVVRELRNQAQNG